MSDMISTREVAKILSLNVSTIYEWVASGKIPVFRISARKLLFDRAELEAWLRARRIPEAALR